MCVCACVRACVHARARACVSVCVCICVCVCVCMVRRVGGGFDFQLLKAQLPMLIRPLPKSGLLPDVTSDADCRGQKWKRMRSCFRDFKTSIVNQQNKKSSGKRMHVGFLFCFWIPFLSIVPVMLLRFRTPLD